MKKEHVNNYFSNNDMLIIEFLVNTGRQKEKKNLIAYVFTINWTHTHFNEIVQCII